MPEAQPPKKGIVLGVQSQLRTLAFPAARLYRWMPVAAKNAEAPDVSLLVSQEVLYRVHQHVSESLEHEIGGFLLGNRYRCPQTRREFVMIDQTAPGQFTEATSVTLAFTPEAWARLADQMNGKFTGKLLVGWYHSHPKMNIFLSQSDVPIHERRFADPWMSALVIDPARALGGFFCRRKGKLDPMIPVEFYEYLSAPAADLPDSSMIWHGYIASDAQTGAEVSPRRSDAPPASPPVLETAVTPIAPPPESAAGFADVHSQPFPSERAYHWIPREGGEAGAPDTNLLVSQDVLNAVQEKVSESLDYEIGGFLLGNRYRCPNTGVEYVAIDQYSPAQFTEATGVSLAFTVDAWSKLAEELSGKFLGKMLVGWYHSHPKMGIFLSNWDVELHEKRFSEAWMSALVIDPQRRTGGFFCRRQGRLDPRVPVEFYELREAVGPAPGESAVPWSGYLCKDASGAEIDPPRRRVREPLAGPAAQTEMARPVVRPAPPPKKSGLPMAALAAVAVAVLGAGTYLTLRAKRPSPPTVQPAVAVDYSVGVIDARADRERPDDGVTMDVAIRPKRPLADTLVVVAGEPVLDVQDISSDAEALTVRLRAASPTLREQLRNLRTDTSVESTTVKIEDRTRGNAVLASLNYDLTTKIYPQPPVSAKTEATKADKKKDKLKLADENPGEKRVAAPPHPPASPPTPVPSKPPYEQVHEKEKPPQPPPTPAPTPVPAPKPTPLTVTQHTETGKSTQSAKVEPSPKPDIAKLPAPPPAEKTDVPNDPDHYGLKRWPKDKEIKTVDGLGKEANNLAKDLRDCIQTKQNQAGWYCRDHHIKKIYAFQTKLAGHSDTVSFPELRERIADLAGGGDPLEPIKQMQTYLENVGRKLTAWAAEAKKRAK